MSLTDSIYKTSSSSLSSIVHEKDTARIPVANPSAARTVTSKKETEDKAKDLVTKTLAAISLPNAANRPYGTGTTIRSSAVAAYTFGQVAIDNGEDGQIAGETTFLEARARTYSTKTGYGAEAQAGLFRSEYGMKVDIPLAATEGGHELFGFGTQGKVEGFVGAQVNAQAGAGFKKGLPVASASALAFAGARADVSAGTEVRVVGIGARVAGSAEAWAGAQGSASVSASPAGVSAEVEGFAGAEASASLSGSIMGIGVTGEADAYAGAGGKAGLSLGYKDGEITISAELGAALGLGAGSEVSVGINLDQFLGDGSAFLGAAGEVAGDAANTAGEVAEDVFTGAGQAAGQAVDAVMDFFGF